MRGGAYGKLPPSIGSSNSYHSLLPTTPHTPIHTRSRVLYTMIASAKSSKRPLTSESFERDPPGKFPKTFHANGKPEPPSSTAMDNSCQKHDDREQHTLQATPLSSNGELNGVTMVNKLRGQREQVINIHTTET